MRLVLLGILTYVVLIVISMCLVLSGAAGKGLNEIPIPWQYDYPYQGELTVVWVPPHKTQEECKKRYSLNVGPLKYIMACAGNNDADTSKCTVVLPLNDGTWPEKFHQYLVRHEIAHCNGWRH